MNKINIPKTELCASTLAHGTDYFGSTVNRDVCMELTDHDLKAGGKVIDTADSHVRWLPGGEHQSEKVIGEWLRERAARTAAGAAARYGVPRRSSKARIDNGQAQWPDRLVARTRGGCPLSEKQKHRAP